MSIQPIRRNPDRTRRRLLQTAIRLFAAHGLSQVLALVFEGIADADESSALRETDWHRAVKARRNSKARVSTA